jgi:hypothetical protein
MEKERNMSTAVLEWSGSASMQDMSPMVKEEAARIETALRNKDEELAAMLADPAARLGVILGAKRDRGELSAYLKGLRFLEDALNHSL